jgi:catechol 2,3-dioxygenase
MGIRDESLSMNGTPSHPPLPEQSTTSHHVLPPGTHIASATLGVADLDRSLRFYRDLAGLREMSRDGPRVSLGTEGAPILHLLEERDAAPPPPRATGLYHTAILYPDRAALARVIRHIAAKGHPFTGASDHLVSEAFYLDDPDGLGVELYRDRPRSEWKWNGDTIQMASLPLDVDDVLAAADRAFDGAPRGTRIGHLHLKVSDIAQAEAFYGDVAGFSVMTRFGSSATFLAADGYHHHIGANTWQSLAAGPAPAGHAGLRSFVINTPRSAPRDLVDPWGHRVTLHDVSVQPA